MLLVAFASTEGQTRKIAERIASFAQARGQKTELYDTDSIDDIPSLDKFGAIIVAASVHEDRHQESIANFAIAHREQLRRKKAGFISVSLSAATDKGKPEAQHYADRFAGDTGWSPSETLLLGGALQWEDCDYFQRQVLTHILADRGLTPDLKGRHEFTDWAALERFVEGFLPERK